MERQDLTVPTAFADLRQKSIDKAWLIHANIKDESNAPKNAALLCSSSEDFLFAWLGLMRLGYSVLLIAYDNRHGGDLLKLIQTARVQSTMPASCNRTPLYRVQCVALSI